MCVFSTVEVIAKVLGFCCFFQMFICSYHNQEEMEEFSNKSQRALPSANGVTQQGYPSSDDALGQVPPGFLPGQVARPAQLVRQHKAAAGVGFL